MPEFRDHSDFLNKSTTLRKAGSARTFFDPKNDDHVESLKTFVRTGNWGSASFFCEAPYTDVPMTVLMTASACGVTAGRSPASRHSASSRLTMRFFIGVPPFWLGGSLKHPFDCGFNCS